MRRSPFPAPRAAVDIARGEELVVVAFCQGGGFASEKVPAHRLSASHITLVIDKGHVRTADEQLPLLQDRARRRQRRKPETIQLRVSAAEHQALDAAAKAKRVRIATLIMDMLRAQGLLPR